jgi:hypothetical protein
LSLPSDNQRASIKTPCQRQSAATIMLPSVAADLILIAARSSPRLPRYNPPQSETSVLFKLIAARYERRSLLITANTPLGEWNRLFPTPR